LIYPDDVHGKRCRRRCSVWTVHNPVDPQAVVAKLRAAGCVFAEDEAELLLAAAGSPDELVAMTEQRVAGLPLEHILGWVEFGGLRIAVDPGVFVPRRRTEFLVQHAASLIRTDPADPGSTDPANADPAIVVDMCCGSGAVGVALVAAVNAAASASVHPAPVALYAVDVDPAAVACAQRNVSEALGRVYHGDLFDPLPESLRGRIDILVANAPYVPTDAIGMMPPEARLFEPHVALDGGADGLDVTRRVVAGATRWLAPRGWLLIETSVRQAPRLADIFAGGGLVAKVVRDEELDATVVVGRRS
jgi:release factor glutamine methyltransferase